MDWTIFAWYIATLFAMLVACWMLASASFVNNPRPLVRTAGNHRRVDHARHQHRPPADGPLPYRPFSINAR